MDQISLLSPLSSNDRSIPLMAGSEILSGFKNPDSRKTFHKFCTGKLSGKFPGDNWRKNLTNLYRTSKHCVIYYKGKLTKSWSNSSGKYWKRNLPQSLEIQPIGRALFFPYSPDNFQVNFAHKEMRKLNSYPHWTSPFFI